MSGRRGRPDQAPWRKGEILIDRFRVEGHTAGGMGIVYKVTDLHNRNSIPVAAKTYKGEFLWNRSVRRRFQQEASTWLKLRDCPNIVEAAFVQNVRDRTCVFMEFVEGLPLDRLISERRLDVRLSLAFAIQLCQGMVDASRAIRGIVHRDLKPDNLLVTGWGLLKIADWGLAKVAQEASGRSLGTWPYMSPEQFNDPASVDTRSDLYSFGVILYRMLTGSFPFEPGAAAGKSGWRSLHGRDRPEPPNLDDTEAPERVKALTVACLARDRDARPQSFDPVLAELQGVYQSQYGERVNVVAESMSDDKRLANEAASWSELGEFERAVAASQSAISSNPALAGAWINLGIALASLNRKEEAIEAYDHAIALAPDEQLAWNNRGNALRALGRIEEARRSFDKALELDPRYNRAWNNKGWLLLSAQSRAREALDCFNKALACDPNNVDALNNRGLAQRRLGQPDDAAKSFDTALEIAPTHLNALSNRAGLMIENGEYEEAIALCDSAVALSAEAYGALNQRGVVALHMGLPVEALEWFDRAIASKEKENRHEALGNRGLALKALGRLGEAEKSLKEARALNPAEAAWHAALGLMHQESGDVQAAREAYADAEAAGSTDPKMYYNYGLLLDGIGRLEEAVEQFRAAIGLREDLKEAYNNLGATLYKLGRFREAADALRRCLEIDLCHTIAHNNLGLALWKLGKHTEALQSYRKAVELDPAYAQAWYNMGLVHMECDEWEEARRSLSEAVRHDPTHVRAWANLSAAALKKNEPREAIRAAKRALALEPGLEVARVNLETAREMLEMKSSRKQETTREDASSQLQRNEPIDPGSVVAVSLVVAKGPATLSTEMLMRLYRLINPDLCSGIDRCGRWRQIQVGCTTCPPGYPDGIMGFTVALGQKETRKGHTVLVQNDLQFQASDSDWSVEGAFLTVIDQPGEGQGQVGFVIKGQLFAKTS